MAHYFYRWYFILAEDGTAPGKQKFVRLKPAAERAKRISMNPKFWNMRVLVFSNQQAREVGYAYKGEWYPS